MRFIYKSCSWLTKLAFYLQTVHLILQTCISLTIVAIHFSNVASHFTIKPWLQYYSFIIAYFSVNSEKIYANASHYYNIAGFLLVLDHGI